MESSASTQDLPTHLFGFSESSEIFERSEFSESFERSHSFERFEFPWNRDRATGRPSASNQLYDYACARTHANSTTPGQGQSCPLKYNEKSHIKLFA